MRDGTKFPRGSATDAPRVRDVADFQTRWPEFRPLAERALRGPALSPEVVDVLGWMIEVMDRIGPRDLDGQD